MMRLAFISIVAAACAAPAPRTGRSTAGVDAPLPALTFPLHNGGTWSSAEQAGRVQLIDVWASWCKPCRKGFAELATLAANHPDVAFVAISLDDEAAAIDRFTSEVAVTVPIAHDREQSLLEPPLSIERVPTLLLIDAGGVVRHRIEEPGSADYDALPGLLAGMR